MAKSNIKGRDVGVYVEKTPGSGTYTRIGCVGDASLSITTESDESTCSDSTNFKEFEPGQISWDGSMSLTARQLTDVPASGGTPAQTDATDGVNAENLIDYQLAGRKFLLRVTLGEGAGSARYGGTIFITKNDLKGQLKGVATGSVSFQGSGALSKTITPG